MRFGVTCFLTDRSIRPDELAREVECMGFDSLFLPEHTHIPSSRATPAPMGEPLPEQYRRCVDPFIALTAAALVTERIRIGTGICLLAQRDPIITAKEVASIELLAPGRFVFGVGYGWNREEAADHGVPWEARRDVVHEKLRAVRTLWTEDEASFDGEHVGFAPSWQWPKPQQAPPVWLGVSAGERNLDALVEHADGWIPIGGSGLRRTLPVLRERLAAAGRDPAEFEVVPFGSTPDADKFGYFAELGITETVANAPSADRDEVLPWLEDYARVVERLG